MATLYDELIGKIREYDASYDTDPAAGEATQQHLARLTRYVARDLPEAGWDTLSTGVQDWHDKAADALRVNTDVPEIAGYPEKPAARRTRAALPDDAPRTDAPARRGRAQLPDDPPAEPAVSTVWDVMRSAILAHNKDHLVDRAPKEEVLDHLKRTLRYFGRTLPEPDFDKLPESVRDYYEEQAKLAEKGQPFVPPNGYPTGNISTAATAPTGNGAVPAAAETQSRRNQTAGDGEANATDRIIDYVVKNHALEIGKIKDAMGKADSGLSDLKESTRAVVAANALKVIARVKGVGLWKV